MIDNVFTDVLPTVKTCKKINKNYSELLKELLRITERL